MKEKQGRRKIKHSLFVRFVKQVLIVFKKKPVIIQDAKTIQSPALFIANHNGASGPITYTLYMPEFFIPWGAHPMTESLRSRWRYLYRTFYRQKLKYSPFRAALMATLLSPISIWLYRGVHLIPSYEDQRFISTLRKSMAHLKNNHSILIYPEDSSEGYFEAPKRFHSGFVVLATYYRRKTGKDLPIYLIHHNRQKNTMRIGEAQTVAQFEVDERNYDAIANHFHQSFLTLMQRNGDETDTL